MREIPPAVFDEDVSLFLNERVVKAERKFQNCDGRFWKLTRSEFTDATIAPGISGSIFVDHLEFRHKQHRSFVADAVRFKFKVPAAVMADYPDLMTRKRGKR